MRKKKTIIPVQCTRNPCKSWNDESTGIPDAQVEPYIPDGCQVVFMGTVTPQEGIDNGYFYSSSKNLFWEFMDNAFISIGCSNPDFEGLKDGLIKNKTNSEPKRSQEKVIIRNEFHDKFASKDLPWKIAVCDIIKSCEVKDVSSTDDKDIISVNEYYWLNPISYHKTIKIIVANSRQVITYCKRVGLIPPKTKEKTINPLIRLFDCSNGLKVYLVPSPSGNSKLTKAKKEDTWKHAFASI